MANTPYQTLGVAATASQQEIKDAYRNLAKKLHPDLNPGNKQAEKRFKEVNSAYEKIGTPEERAKFDRGEREEAEARAEAGRAGARPFYHETQRDGGRYTNQYSFGGEDDELFQSIFGQMGGQAGGARRRPARSADALYRLEIPLRDAVLGGEREIALPDGRRLRVKIPPGVDSGARLRFPGYGPATPGVAAGDAYVELTVAPSSLFTRRGTDLEVELPISVAESILGAEVKAPTLEGSIMLKVPAGASTGQKLRAAGKGIPRATGGTRGDLYYILKIMAPKEVDADFKAAVTAWSQRQPFDARAGWPGSGKE